MRILDSSDYAGAVLPAEALGVPAEFGAPVCSCFRERGEGRRESGGFFSAVATVITASSRPSCPTTTSIRTACKG